MPFVYYFPWPLHVLLFVLKIYICFYSICYCSPPKSKLLRWAALQTDFKKRNRGFSTSFLFPMQYRALTEYETISCKQRSPSRALFREEKLHMSHFQSVSCWPRIPPLFFVWNRVGPKQNNWAPLTSLLQLLAISSSHFFGTLTGETPSSIFRSFWKRFPFRDAAALMSCRSHTV